MLQPMLEQTLVWKCSLSRGAHGGAGDMVGAAASGGSMLEQSIPEEWTLWYGSILEQFLENCHLLEAHIGSLWKDGIP